MTSERPEQRLVVLISGAGSIMAALLESAQTGTLGARVAAVISDTPDAPGLQVARDAGVPTAVVAMGDFPDRGAWNRGMVAALDAFSPDLVVCAGFMRILGEAVVGRYEHRLVNTHPALLPAFPGAHAVRDALAHGAKVTGCTVHLIDAGVDTGPILAQRAVEVLPGDDEASLHGRIKEVERALVVETVQAMVAHGWSVQGRVARIGAVEEGR